MKIVYDNQGRLSEIKFEEGENQEACLKTLDHYIDKLAESSKFAIDKNVESNRQVMEYNYAMAQLRFGDNQLKPCNVDNDPNKGIPLTT